MFKVPKGQILLWAIFAFALVYRLILVFWQTYPPGADIGLHNSIIHSITQGGSTNFLWNNYHMGGGTSNTFPGYHIFVSFVIAFTGLPDYLVQAFIAVIFSSLMVPVAFLITRKLVNENIAYIVAFLVAVSYYDIFMLLWSGYPNIVTLMLIPLTFYLLLEKNRFPPAPRLTAASLLSAAIFLTHSLSALMFISIIFVSVLVALCFPRRVGVDRRGVLEWLVPVFIGGLIVSPFLIQAAPSYLNLNSALYTGGLSNIQKLLLPDRLVPLQYVLPFFVCCVLSIVFLKYMHVKLRQFSTVLLVSWLIVGTVLTQAFMVGLYTDYERFLYFADLPLIIVVAMGIFLGANLLSKNTNRLFSAKNSFQKQFNKNMRLKRVFSQFPRTFFALFAAILILFACFCIPHFSMTPDYCIKMQSQLQVMNQPGYDAIQWIKNNTPADSVFVADALYGWWLGGFAQRPTVGAVDPIFITNSREFEPALLATRLLDTDYLVDNGLIQVREDGGYSAMNNPEFLVKLANSYYPHPFLNFNNSQTTITFKANGHESAVKLSDLPVRKMDVKNSTTYAAICVTRGDEFFNFSQTATLYQGMRFVNMTQTISSNNPKVNLIGIDLALPTKGDLAFQNIQSLALVDPNADVAGQLIFTGNQPEITQEPKGTYELLYNLNNQTDAQINFYVSVFALQGRDPNPASLRPLFLSNLESYESKLGEFPMDVFDYHQAIVNLNASYIAVRDPMQIQRFANDPTFSLVFANKEASIFRVQQKSINY